MLRLARLRPLPSAILGCRWSQFPRAYASTEPATPPPPTTRSTDPNNELLNAILDNIAPSTSKSTSSQRGTTQQWTGNNKEGTTSQSFLVNTEGSQLDAFNFKDFPDSKFGDNKFTTRSYDRFFGAYPALKHEVDTHKLHARLKYDQIYLKDHAHEPKTVFKFKNVVTKNYRTIARSWPMVRLNSFKYGHEHFLDEMYDDIQGKYLTTITKTATNIHTTITTTPRQHASYPHSIYLIHPHLLSIILL